MLSISTIARLKADLDKTAEAFPDKEARLNYWKQQKELAEKKIKELGEENI